MTKFKGPLLAAGCIFTIVLIIGGIKVAQFSSMAKSGAAFVEPPVSVSAFVTEIQTWPNTIKTVGSVRSEQGITLSAELAGRIEAIYFESGDSVEQGQLLLSQETSSEQAQLDAAEAQLRLAQYNFDRIAKLLKQKTVSENEYEISRQELKAASADVQSLQSNLAKKQIRARFSGIVGIRKVDLGQDLTAGAAIVDLYSYQNLKVDFPIPQRWVNQLKVGQSVQINMIENKDQQVLGHVNAIGVAVNETTRNMEVQATLNDSTHKLLPGMAVEVELNLAQNEEFLVIPAMAVVYAPYGDTVFIIEEDPETNKLIARQQFIQISARQGDFVAVSKGLKANDKIANAGAFKLYNGQSIKVTSQQDPKLSLTPTPSDS